MGYASCEKVVLTLRFQVGRGQFSRGLGALQGWFPVLKQHQGFERAFFVTDASSGRIMFCAQWRTQDDLEEFLAAGVLERSLESLYASLEEAPVLAASALTLV